MRFVSRIVQSQTDQRGYRSGHADTDGRQTEIEKEQLDQAWAFLQANFDRLAERQEPTFRDGIAPDLLASFPDRRFAEALEGFAPARATPGGRIAMARGLARLQSDIEQSTRLMPQIDSWVSTAKP